jgi:hypothetical protein
MLKIMAGGLSERERERETKTVGVDFHGSLMAGPLEEEVPISNSSKGGEKED